MNKRDKLPHAPLIVRIFGEFVDEPPFFARGLDLKKDQEDGGRRRPE